MTSNLFIPLFFAVLVPVYLLWIYSVAINVRGKVADEVDEYLGANHPETMKVIVFHTFDNCLSVFLPFKLLFYFLSGADESSRHMVKTLKSKFGQDEINKMANVLSKVMIVNIVRSPISYVLCALVFLVFCVFRFVLSASLGAINNTKWRLEDAFFKVMA